MNRCSHTGSLPLTLFFGYLLVKSKSKDRETVISLTQLGGQGIPLAISGNHLSGCHYYSMQM